MSCKALLLCVLALPLALALLLLLLLQDGLVPRRAAPVIESQWWGEGEGGGREDTAITPFTVAVSNDTLADLRDRIR